MRTPVRIWLVLFIDLLSFTSSENSFFIYILNGMYTIKSKIVAEN